MRSRLVIAVIFAAGVAGQDRGGRGGGGAPAVPGPCDRACLEGFVNQYLDALVAHNPFGLPLASKVKFSENDQVLELGDGLWNVTTDVGSYKLYVAEPQSQQVGFFGTLRENDRPVGPNAAANTPPPPPLPPTGAAALEAMKPDPVFLETVPQNQRVAREELIKAANSYFDAIEKRDGRVKMLSYYQTIYPRRFPVVDEERQLVFGFFMHQQPGDLLSVESPGRGTYELPDNVTQPSFTEVAELFRIKGGKIRKMEALTLNVPYGTPNPFFNDDWRRPAK